LIRFDKVKEFLTHEKPYIRRAARDFFVKGYIFENEVLLKLLDCFENSNNYYEEL
jgi:hypothetical protein